ncbi:MAG TPA: L-threonylcarbamoyladenylate synthase [Sedimentisphaerales bacterium]|nr:L-threonylcarbamoyladenylate synthase [Sedimentisphaerales bacterium]
MKTQVFKLDRSSPDPAVIRTAAEVVEAGGLVILPTESFYCIACRAAPSAINRLDSIKRRSPLKSYSLHIAETAAVRRYVPHMSPPASKLAERLWPGPLTIVFDLSDEVMSGLRQSLPADEICLYSGSSIAVRCPDDAVAAALLGAARCPVVATSANLSGQPPAVEGSEAATQFEDQVDIVLDAGRCRYQKGSTVVRIWARGLEMLREGFYTESDIRQAMRVSVLFVCAGNTCRSPMAEGLYRKYLAAKLGCSVDRLDEMGYKAGSAGVTAMNGLRASALSVKFCASEGIDISGHRSRQLDEELVRQSDQIFVMSRSQLELIRSHWPSAAAKCELLAGQAEITDPVGGSEEFYQKCGQHIKAALQKRLGEQPV